MALRADWRVLSVISSLGARVAAAGPKLLERWHREFQQGSSSERGVVSRAVGLVVGPPRSADDARVQTFLTVLGQVRGAMVPPDDLLEAAVLACGGAEHLAPWVLEPLIGQLREPDFKRRVDAALRLRPLRAHAAPAGPALEAVLREEIRGPRAKWSGISDLAWTLSLAGEAAARALPLFIEMLELPDVARAGLHALDGQSELFGAAIPAIEAYLARTEDKSARANIERTLERVRHLSAQAQTKR